MDDLVTIVIPVYNSEKFLINTIESILNQTYKNIEIIAVDDGSTDNSISILEEFSNSISIIKKTHSGLGSSLNRAIEAMNGKWFKWISPDDVLLPNFISQMICESKNFLENVILYSNWVTIDKNNHILKYFHENNFNKFSTIDFNVRLLDKQQINVNTTLISRDIFDKGCVFRNLNDYSTIDYDFFLRAGVLYNTKFFLVEQSLLQYRIHKNQLSHQNIVNTLKNIETIKKEVLSMLNPGSREIYKKLLKEYGNKKSFIEKLEIFSLNFIKKFPSIISDYVITFYLNNLRTHR